MRLLAHGISDVGCVRTNNEDAFLVRKDLPLFVVADGMGGAAAGEVASQLLIESCEVHFTQDNSNDGLEMIKRCLLGANDSIVNHTRRHPETKGMGCTAEILSFHDGRYMLGHIGDSRTYVLRHGKLQQLTKDHSYLQEQIEKGNIRQEDAKGHWMRSAIYRAVGHISELDIDTLSGDAERGDCFLLCSDGLTDLVPNSEIESTMLQRKSLESCNQELIDLAKERGGKDNITCVLVEIG